MIMIMNTNVLFWHFFNWLFSQFAGQSVDINFLGDYEVRTEVINNEMMQKVN